MDTAGVARLLIGIGAVLVLTGLVVLALSRLGIARFPGDFTVEIGGLRLHLLLGLSILLSVIGTIVLNVMLRR